MDFMTAVRTVLQQKYADFNGRAPRSEYWWFVLAYAIAYLVAAVIGGILGKIGMFLPLLLALAVLVPMIAVSVRRLHDVDKSGWFMLIPIYNLILALTEGTKGPNRFGPDPKDPSGSEVFA